MIFSLPLTTMLFILLISRGNAKSVRMMSSSTRMSQIVMIFFIISEVTIYSVSVEDNEIPVCFVEHQNTGLPAILIRDLIINFLSCKSASQSESEYYYYYYYSIEVYAV